MGTAQPAGAVVVVVEMKAKREKTPRNGARRRVLSMPVTIIASTHERPERHAHCRVRDDGVPVLHVEPLRARLRQLRVVVQELEQDDDEVVTPRAQSWAKGATERAIHRTKKKNETCNFKKMSREKFFHYSFN